MVYSFINRTLLFVSKKCFIFYPLRKLQLSIQRTKHIPTYLWANKSFTQFKHTHTQNEMLSPKIHTYTHIRTTRSITADCYSRR